MCMCERKGTCEDCNQHSSFPHIVGTDVSETSTGDRSCEAYPRNDINASTSV